MGIFHFLNVLNGDCSIVEHPSGNVTVIDVNNAGSDDTIREALRKGLGVLGNYHQKNNPVDPITYLTKRGGKSVFRFILTHPDMDHMGGIERFFEVFAPVNFWDTDNIEEKDFGGPSPHSDDDWRFYKKLRDTKPQSNPKRLVLNADAVGKYFNQTENGAAGGDGLYVLAPTPEITKEACESGECNDYSYVVLYRSTGGRILIAADSHNITWEHLLKNHREDIANVEVLLAPHHGRDSGRAYAFLDVVKPKLTLFGNADSEHLGHSEWSKRGLAVLSNNQAGSVVLDTNSSPIKVYITNEAFARRVNPATYLDPTFDAYYLLSIT